MKNQDPPSAEEKPEPEDRLTEAELERAAGGISTQGGNTGEHQIKGLNPKMFGSGS